LGRRSTSGKVGDSGEWTCSCGHVMHHEANFCSRCGRRSLRLLQSTFEADLINAANELSLHSSDDSTSIPEDSETSSLTPPVVSVSRHNSPLHSLATFASASRHTTPLHSHQSSAASCAERDQELLTPAFSPKRPWKWSRQNSPRDRDNSPTATPSVYKGWMRSKSQAELEANSSPDGSKHRRDRTLKRHNSGSEPDNSPRGTPARRPSLPDGNRWQIGIDDSRDVQGLLTQTLKHSGSFKMNFVRVRVLALPSNLTSAFSAAHKADLQMPLFDARVDCDNILIELGSDILNPSQVSMQRVSFMGTDWLGIRLEHQTHYDCITFCVCTAALLNIGKSTSRTVVVEACGDGSKHYPGFACIPISDQSDEVISTLFEYAKDISELADIICNEPAHSTKKVTADLKKWCHKGNRQRGGLKKASKFSLRRMVESLENQFTALTPMEVSDNARFKGDQELRRRPSRGEDSRPRRSRRKSCPALRTQMSELSFTGICESEEEDEMPVQRSATYAQCPVLPSYNTEDSSDSEATVEEYRTDVGQMSGDTSQDRRRYSTGNMLRERRRSGQLISLRRSSSATLE